MLTKHIIDKTKFNKTLSLANLKVIYLFVRNVMFVVVTPHAVDYKYSKVCFVLMWRNNYPSFWCAFYKIMNTVNLSFDLVTENVVNTFASFNL